MRWELSEKLFLIIKWDMLLKLILHLLRTLSVIFMKIAVVLAAVLSPALYRLVITNPALETSAVLARFRFGTR